MSPEPQRAETVTRVDARASRGAISVAGVPIASTLAPRVPTMLHALARAAEGPHGITLYGDDERASFRSYAQLLLETRRVAAGLRARGVREGDRVLLTMPTSFDFVTAFFALSWLGAVPVPSYPPAALERLELGVQRLAHIAGAAQTTLCITSAQLRPLLGELALHVPALREIVGAESLDGEDASPVDRCPNVSPRTTCFVQFTSGSTGRPKGVVLTHANVTSNIEAMGLAMRANEHDRVVSWLPLYHDMGLIGGLLCPIYLGIPLALTSPMAFIERPIRWLKMISETRGTMSPAPNFGYALCVKRARPRDLEGLDLSSWRLALNGAEPVSARTVEEFRAAFAPLGLRPETMFPVYGLAESSLAVTFNSPGAVAPNLRVSRAALAHGNVAPGEGTDATTLVCVGKALPGHTVLVVDDLGRPVAQGTIGNVVVHGPSIMRGYLDDAVATSRALRRGWLWTGDLGFETGDGFYVTGRAKDLIIVRGKNFYAEDAERAVEAIDGVRGGGVVVFGVYDDQSQRDRVTCVCETRLQEPAEREQLAEEIRRRIGDEIGLALDQVVLVAPGTIPKTSSGKRQRGQTRALYLKDALAPQRESKRALAGALLRSALGRLHLVLRSRRPA